MTTTDDDGSTPVELPRFLLEFHNLDPDHSRIVRNPDGTIRALYMWADPVDPATQPEPDWTGWVQLGATEDPPPALTRRRPHGR